MTRITFLGTGTSHGIPVIGCSCPVCKSTDPHDNRYRSSILIERDGTSVVIDTGYEFRLQCLRANITKLDGVLYTHSHSDHLMGLDDLRVFTKDRLFPVYSFESVIEDIKIKFPYAFKHDVNVGQPQMEARTVYPYKEFQVGSITFLPIPVYHGSDIIAGYRFGNAAYITDVSNICLDKNKEWLSALDVLIIGALREEPHVKHYSFKQAAFVSHELGAKRTYFTHLNHAHTHSYVESTYNGIATPAYDGLVLEV